MSEAQYALGTTGAAARRLAIQDEQFAEVSERLLDRLDLGPNDRVVELGTGAGSFGRRVLRRLGPGGALLAVDYSQGLLDQARENLVGAGPASVELVACDIQDISRWADRADVVVGRTVLHHLAFPEVLLGRLTRILRPGTRLGFIEPEFRVFIGRLAAIEAQGTVEALPLRRWAEGISRYYQARGLAPCIGASLGRTLEAAGYRDVACDWAECPMNAAGIENMLLYYDEIRERYTSLGIMTSEEIDRDKRLLAALSGKNLPPLWGTHAVTCVVG